MWVVLPISSPWNMSVSLASGSGGVGVDEAAAVRLHDIGVLVGGDRRFG